MVKLTKRQLEILNLIQSQIDTIGSPPTRAEIALKMGFCSPNAAEDHLRALARKGIIELIPGTSRGIRILKTYDGLPIIGRVAAGQPILAEENIEASYRIDQTIFKPIANYLLKVKGSSMQNAGIHDGDLLAVHATPNASLGQIIVARIEDEVTVKRLSYQDNHRIILQAANPEFEPIEINLQTQALTIEGIVVGVIRVLATK